MRPEGLDEVFRAGWLIPASAARPADRLEEWRDGALVNADEKYEQRNHARGGKIESRRARSNHSPLNSSKPARAAPGLAMTTIRHPAGNPAREARTSSRIRRRVLFRTTAPPTRLEVIIPVRAQPGSPGKKRRASFRSRPCADFPPSRTREKSRPSCRRAALGNRSRSGGRVAGVVDFDTLWQEALAPTLAAAAQDGPARLGLHARAEPKLLLARAFGRLVCAFHKIGSVEPDKLAVARRESIGIFADFWFRIFWAGLANVPRCVTSDGPRASGLPRPQENPGAEGCKKSPRRAGRS